MTDYIPRLREELVAAATREQAGLRHRPRVSPRRLAPALATAAVVAAVVAAVLVVELPRDETAVAPTPAQTALAYRVAPAPGTDAAAAARASADVLRERIAEAGIRGATVTVDGDRIGVDGASSALGQVAALTVPGTLGIYDWEASVLGPDGQPGDAGAAGPGAGTKGAVSRYEAVRRAAKAQSGGGPPAYWLVDASAKTVLAGPAGSRDALPKGGDVIEVPGGVRVVRAEAAATGGWYALADKVAVGNADVATARASRDPATGDPIVAFDLDAHGQAAFTGLTRGIAQRGADAARPGQTSIEAAQHLAIVLDDRIAAVPFIDFGRVPDGIDGRSGVQIQGGLSPERARQIAAILESGPMPATLEAMR